MIAYGPLLNHAGWCDKIEGAAGPCVAGMVGGGFVLQEAALLVGAGMSGDAAAFFFMAASFTAAFILATLALSATESLAVAPALILLSALSDALMSFFTRDASFITAASACAVVGPSRELGRPWLTAVWRTLFSPFVMSPLHGAKTASKTATANRILSPMPRKGPSRKPNGNLHLCALNPASTLQHSTDRPNTTPNASFLQIHRQGAHLPPTRASALSSPCWTLGNPEYFGLKKSGKLNPLATSVCTRAHNVLLKLSLTQNSKLTRV